MKPLELPARPEGELTEQVTQLWEDLFRLVERLNVERDSAAPNGEKAHE